ncbi:MAG TPA: winged helix-turn-helix domain-containing protein [Saprospiraceae bacterium]|nr:winged helix-turn-helix domain-containing protein [Saprospiraceae bacterium]
MIQLDDDTIKRLRLPQRKHKDKRVYIKVTVLLMLHQGFTAQMIAESLGIDDSTVYRYQQGFADLGLDDYLKDFFVAYSGQLTKEEEQLLRSEIRQGLYINSNQVAAYIQLKFGVRYSLSVVVKQLHRLGFSYKKTKGVGLKANPEVQEQFVKELTDILTQSNDNQAVY